MPDKNHTKNDTFREFVKAKKMEPSDTTNSTIFVGDDTMNSTSGDMGNEGRNSKIVFSAWAPKNLLKCYLIYSLGQHTVYCRYPAFGQNSVPLCHPGQQPSRSDQKKNISILC